MTARPPASETGIPGGRRPAAARLRIADLARLAGVGLQTRKLRAALSALGIAIGVAAIVAVLGLSSSSAAALNAEIAALGTNLLTVQTGQGIGGQPEELPLAAPAMIGRLPGAYAVQDTGTTTAGAYRSPPFVVGRSWRIQYRCATTVPFSVALTGFTWTGPDGSSDSFTATGAGGLHAYHPSSGAGTFQMEVDPYGFGTTWYFEIDSLE